MTPCPRCRTGQMFEDDDYAERSLFCLACGHRVELGRDGRPLMRCEQLSLGIPDRRGAHFRPEKRRVIR